LTPARTIIYFLKVDLQACYQRYRPSSDFCVFLLHPSSLSAIVNNDPRGYSFPGPTAAKALHKGADTMKSTAKVAAAALLTCVIAGYPFAQSFSNTASTSWHAATFTVATDKAVYDYPTDSLAVQYTITNNSNATQTYGPFGGTCEYDLILSLTDGTEIYRVSTYAMCLENLTDVSVPAGGSVVHDFAMIHYPPDVDTYVATLSSVVFTVSAQLRGTVYDSTRASVNITVKRPAKTVFGARVHTFPTNACFLSRGALLVSVPSAQRVAVAAFLPDGRVFPQASISREFAAGTYILPLSCAEHTGVYVVRIRGETFQTTLKAVAGTGP
jgi:hypothetical protein